MNLMGRYAAANHALIHKHIARKLGAHVILEVENHHNFAWKERHVIDGEEREVIVHRKGATPAGAGVMGIIPGSMASPGFVVRGKGEPESLHSASHGAGRLMSRSKALQSFTWSAVKKLLGRARGDAPLRRPRRSARRLQGHRAGDGCADQPGRSAWPLRPATRQNVSR